MKRHLQDKVAIITGGGTGIGEAICLKFVLTIWRRWADQVQGRALAGGHFLMEESPQELTALVMPFLRDAFREDSGARLVGEFPAAVQHR